MSDPSKRKDPNATIQIDLDQVQLYDPSATPPPASPSEPGARKVPPPLPPSASLPGIAPAPPPSPAKTIAYVAMIVVLVGLAILGGLMVGTRARGTPQVAPAPSSTVADTPAPSAAPSASAAPATLTLPTIEMR
jgi:hypothetical protein